MIDIFDIMGPIMVGPSSSHTAGAVRIGRMARTLLGEMPAKAVLHLHGSFAKTGMGHGTDRALIAGLLGMAPDDYDIPDSFQIAGERGMEFYFDEVELRDAHPNSVFLELWGVNGTQMSMKACSVGGGRIQVNELDGIALNFTGDYNTLIVRNQDERGYISNVTHALALAKVDIANMSFNRSVRGGSAIMLIETDNPIPETIRVLLGNLSGILQITYYEKEV